MMSTNNSTFSKVSTMKRVTLKIAEDTHRELIKIISRKQDEEGRRITIDEILKEIIEMYKNEFYKNIEDDKQQKNELKKESFKTKKTPSRSSSSSDEGIVKKKDENLYLQKIAQELSHSKNYHPLGYNKKLDSLDFYSLFHQIAKETGRSPSEIAEEMLREAQGENERSRM